MTYLAALRAKRTVLIVMIVLTVLAAIATYFVVRAELRVHTWTQHSPWPFSALLAGTGVIAVIVATILGSALDGVSRAPALAFTRPEPRALSALRIYAVDAVAVLAVWAAGVVLAVIGAVITRTFWVTFGADIAGVLFLFCAVSLMWYALITLTAVFFPGRGGAISGASWAIALILPGLAAIGFPQPVHGLLQALLYLDPMAYLQGHAGVDLGSSPKQSPIDLLFTTAPARAAVAGAIGVVALALATRFWTTREVSA
ncbi:MAG TPA: hypothetical protein VGN14_07395 [Candidatus Elarobacter sp.]|jgi:hypothetical protein